MKLATALIIPDTHRPFHHIRAYKLMLSVAAYIKPQEIVFLGDYADFYSVSSHGNKDPRLPTLLLEEVEDVNKGFDEIDKLFPKAKKVFIEGNHEWRLERYLCDNAPAIFGVTDIQHLFKFHERGYRFIRWSPDQKYQVMGSPLYCRHRPLASTAKGTAAKALCSLAYGDIHRIEESHLVGMDGTNHVCFSVGWLGDKKKRAFEFVSGHHQWQLGFGIVRVDLETKLFYHQKVHILERGNKLTCVVDGRRFVA